MGIFSTKHASAVFGHTNNATETHCDTNHAKGILSVIQTMPQEFSQSFKPCHRDLL